MNRFQSAKCAVFLVAALLGAFAVRSAASEFTAQLQLKEGINLSYLPLHDARISSVGKLRELLGGDAAGPILLLNENGIFELSGDEAAFSPSQAFIVVMKQANTVDVQGAAHLPVLNLQKGLNIAVVPRRSQDIRFMSDIAGLSDAIDAIVYASDSSGRFETYPPYDHSLSGGVSFFVIANRSASAPFLGEPWGDPVAPVVSEHIAELLEGVEGIGSPGLPGPLSLISENVFPIAAGKTSSGNDNNIQAPVVAAAFIGNGRAVAFGHDGYLSPVGGQLLLNSARWAAAGRSGEIAVVRLPELAKFLNDAGLKTAEINDASDSGQLNHYAAVCVGTHILTRNMSAEEIRAVRAYVDAGGGLVTAGLGWGWLQLNPGRTIQEHPGNQLLGDKGILWGEGYLYHITPQRGIEHLNVLKAIKLLQTGGGTNKEKTQAVWLVSHALQTLPYDDPLRPKIADLIAAARTYPRPDAPLTSDQAGDWIALTNELKELEQTPPQEIEAHPAAKYFPGEVPAGASTETAVVPVPLNIHGWRSTGLYAAPGALIEINVPDSAVGIGLRARIGAHTDTLWHKTEWRRAPQITTSTEIHAAQTFTANAFGGLIYIDVPPNQPVRTVNVTIKGAVLAPHYILDETDMNEWRSSIRHRPGPWAELETDRIILTVPSWAVRGLDNPDETMRFWNRVVDACADLASEPAPRTRPERIVPDTQISVGYMHAGYPIMTHMDVVQRSLDPAQMLRGSWGHFHEIGHNFQSSSWTFDGAWEVTVNLFTLYVYETVCGIPLHEARDVLASERILQTARWHADNGAPFDKWKSDPFLALTMYAQMIEEFGYDPFKRVFAGYNAPIRDDNEKRDQWMVRFSNEVGRNLGPFFQAWGVPTSSGARTSIQHLSIWLPAPFQ